MRLGDTCQAHRCAGGRLRSTRITRTELAARNRRADFPAPQTSLTPQHVARSRRPRPSSTGTPREGSARQVSRTASRIVGVPVSSRNVATGWRRTGRPARRAGDSRDKRTVPSTEWGYLHPSAHRPRAGGPGSGDRTRSRSGGGQNTVTCSGNSLPGSGWWRAPPGAGGQRAAPLSLRRRSAL
jgi:hypothetical protein